MIWLAFPAAIILLVRLGITLYNLVSGHYLPAAVSGDHPLVSVLIPARNEENNLPVLLDGLIQQRYPRLEIVVYDDQSTDGTGKILEQYAERDSRISWLKGEGFPDGWNGKNHACHQLACRARGSYLLFLDADVQVDPTLVERAVAYASRNDLTLLSMFPRQLMRSAGERLTVPVMNWILLSLLPMSAIRGSHYPSLSAANGQMMFFRAREYRQHQFHRLVSEINVEDIHIMRWVKRMGYRADTLLSRGEISCRMYEKYRDAVFGFTRSMFAFFGGSGATLLLFTIFTTLGVLFVGFGFSLVAAVIYLAVAALMRLLIHYLSRQPALLLLLLSPLIQVSFVWMVVQSFRMKIRGTNTWKERTIQFKGI
jgi:chlorobactene glucosyltransferase